MTVDAKTLLKYMNLQMASEALLDIPNALRQQLIVGNKRASQFTDTQADKFVADGWTVLAHQPDTSTGFSGTLFKNTNTGELVLSFRSTEFVDDSARDSQQTNQTEISDKGWAFGQIDDMEAWYKDLQTRGLITRPVTVTGYSLGGHLATAFTLIRRDQGRSNEIAATYTFNGAGVGDVANVAAMRDRFHALRSDASSLFQTTDGRLLYSQLRASLGTTPTTAQLSAAQSTVAAALSALTETAAMGPSGVELGMLASAIASAKSLRVEIDRVNAGIPDPSGPPVIVPASDVEGLRLDYQLAVLGAAQTTSSYHTGLIAGIVRVPRLRRALRLLRRELFEPPRCALRPRLTLGARVRHPVAKYRLLTGQRLRDRGGLAYGEVARRCPQGSTCGLSPRALAASQRIYQSRRRAPFSEWIVHREVRLYAGSHNSPYGGLFSVRPESQSKAGRRGDSALREGPRQVVSSAHS